MAVLLGPSGVGLIGIYGSITGLIAQVAGMGIGASGVRQIAEASGSNDSVKVARTAITLRRASLFLGVLGMLTLVFLREPICRLTFGNTEHAGALGMLAVSLFLGAVSAGQGALVNGMRRIGDLARLSIFGALFGLLASVPFVWFFGERGIAPFLVTVSAMGLLASWWYARKITIEKIRIPWREMAPEARALLRLGVVFMASGLMTMGTMYLIRVLVVRQLGLDAAGLFQASSAIASLYVGFILSAMGADFYPRLTEVSKDNNLSNRMVNEQTEVSLLLAVPGILGTLTFAPYVIQVFYSAKFTPAMDILRWDLLGILLRVGSWPMGFILLAKGKGKIFFWTELAANIVYLGLAFILLQCFGLPGAGMAFFGLYLLCWTLMFFVVKRVSGFSLSKANRKLYAVILPVISIVFLSGYFLSFPINMLISITVTIIISIYFLRMLTITIGVNQWRKFLSQIKQKLTK